MPRVGDASTTQAQLPGAPRLLRIRSPPTLLRHSATSHDCSPPPPTRPPTHPPTHRHCPHTCGPGGREGYPAARRGTQGNTSGYGPKTLPFGPCAHLRNLLLEVGPGGGNHGLRLRPHQLAVGVAHLVRRAVHVDDPEGRLGGSRQERLAVGGGAVLSQSTTHAHMAHAHTLMRKK
jgi:hypothetical protein